MSIVAKAISPNELTFIAKALERAGAFYDGVCAQQLVAHLGLLRTKGASTDEIATEVIIYRCYVAEDRAKHLRDLESFLLRLLTDGDAPSLTLQ